MHTAAAETGGKNEERSEREEWVDWIANHGTDGLNSGGRITGRMEVRNQRGRWGGEKGGGGMKARRNDQSGLMARRGDEMESMLSIREMEGKDGGVERPYEMGKAMHVLSLHLPKDSNENPNSPMPPGEAFGLGRPKRGGCDSPDLFQNTERSRFRGRSSSLRWHLIDDETRARKEKKEISHGEKVLTDFGKMLVEA
ncbi:unnamed protein product [Pleuronectes platessa]|uniref:Uncharacterized protein n=1 Tax=Pleuronectes platessa TaxID=8262 RepID=A0A9N7Y558_PLEPL|nr:unnamed protein product [Pleuronectes platessa]